MTRIVSSFTVLTLLACVIGQRPIAAAEMSAGQKVLADAARQGQHTFVMFYRGDDAATQSMRQTMQSALADRPDAVILPIRLDDAAETELVARSDAGNRRPGSQRGRHQRLSAAGRNAAVDRFDRARQPGGMPEGPAGSEDRPALRPARRKRGDRVTQFQADPHFKDRTAVVTVTATEPTEAKFLQQLGMRTDQPTCLVAFMAPPGVMIGRYNSKVTHEILAQKLAASGKCCDDPNCKHHHPPASKAPTGR
jgi:hypothetical protein